MSELPQAFCLNRRWRKVSFRLRFDNFLGLNTFIISESTATFETADFSYVITAPMTSEPRNYNDGKHRPKSLIVQILSFNKPNDDQIGNAYAESGKY